MQFCDKCGGLLIPKKKGSRTVLVCRSCGRTTSMKGPKKEFKVKTEMKHKDDAIVVVEKRQQVDTLPKTVAECPKCGNREAFWWMQQTRSGDEPPTRFYKCTKCKHTWREYE